VIRIQQGHFLVTNLVRFWLAWWDESATTWPLIPTPA